MLDRQHNHFVVECDTCGDVLETGTSDFAEAREIMRREGWKVRGEGRKPNLVWIHGCATCGVPEINLFGRDNR